MNLNQITLPVRDMKAATRFYRAMGFLQIVDTPHYARFEAQQGEATFSLALSPEMLQNAAVVYFETEALDQRVADLRARGFEFVQLPTQQSYLWREAVLCDPSGNKIKLYWAGENRRYPPWRVERRGL